MRNVYMTTITTLPGFIWVGWMFNRSVKLGSDRFATSTAAYKAATDRAALGAPIQQRFAVLVMKKVPSKGYRVVGQIDGEVWDDAVWDD